jgi:lambda family phage minor tail protein L
MSTLYQQNSALENSGLIELYELNLKSMGIIDPIEMEVFVNVGVISSTQSSAMYAEPETSNQSLKVVSFDSIFYIGPMYDPSNSTEPHASVDPSARSTALGTSQGGSYSLLYSDTIQYSPPTGFQGLDSFKIVVNAGSIIYFHSGVSAVGEDIIWQSRKYYAYPIYADGFEQSGTGQFPRPVLRVANALSIISQYLESFDDLLGATVKRRRTYVKYLDGVNFGGSNPTADPTAELPIETFRIDRKSSENDLAVEFELAAPWDVEGVQLPRRTIVKNVCAWRYKGSECGYVLPTGAGAKYWNEFDKLTTRTSDKCSKTLSGCAKRFTNAYEGLPYGGFPGAGITR